VTDNQATRSGNGEDGEDGASVALKAANERIAALEAELEATVRLAAELHPEGGAAAGTAEGARVATMEKELADARARIAALQAVLFADWPVQPNAAPR
jgi:hypothetical protein